VFKDLEAEQAIRLLLDYINQGQVIPKSLQERIKELELSNLIPEDQAVL
jgi:hypothetical protein